tara:strand:- start:902 stop:1084 length:183 start_codon:yes stop_codon:yes gene_type:complete
MNLSILYSMEPIQVLSMLTLFIANTNFLNATTAGKDGSLPIDAKITSVDVTTLCGEPISL